MEKIVSHSSSPSSNYSEDNIRNGNLTVGGLKGTGLFLGSRADDFANRAEREDSGRSSGYAAARFGEGMC